MKAHDVNSYIQAIAPVIREAVATSTDAAHESMKVQLAAQASQIARLEGRLDEVKAVTAEEVIDQIDVDKLVSDVIGLLPPPKDGQDADSVAILANLTAHVDKAMAETHERVLQLVAARQLIEERVARLEGRLDEVKAVTAEDVIGQIDVDKLVSDVIGLLPPRDAPTVDELVPVIVAQFERRFSDLALSWERSARDTFDRAADKMPIPKDGLDAIQLSGFEVEQSDDGRELVLRLAAGDCFYEKKLRLPAIVYRGIFRADETYQRGDATSYGGSLWIAHRDAPEGVPGSDNKHWQLAVKKGRDAKAPVSAR